MASPWQFLSWALAQQIGRQELPRRPELQSVTAAADNVVQYDRVMATKLVLAYAAGLETVHQSLPNADDLNAVDLACGPGHYTLCLCRFLGIRRIIGIDLSPGMVETANKNSESQRLADRALFREGDVTRLADVTDGEFGLSSFTDAAHHMPSLAIVTDIFREMDRITRPDGLVMAMDLARLRTAALTERYVQNLGRDYVERRLPDFFDDFHNSMYAAWTPSELYSAIPRDTRRFWCHVVPRGLPTVQIVLGLPVGRKKPFVRSGLPWSPADNPVPAEMRGEWQMLRMSLRLASRRFVPPR
jgi:SAM-dependent methyltransferase